MPPFMKPATTEIRVSLAVDTIAWLNTLDSDVPNVVHDAWLYVLGLPMAYSSNGELSYMSTEDFDRAEVDVVVPATFHAVALNSVERDNNAASYHIWPEPEGTATLSDVYEWVLGTYLANLEQEANI